MHRETKHFYEFGAFRLDPAERLLLHEGRAVALTPKVFDTLLILVQHDGELIEKDELMKRLWADSFVEESNLTYNISVLRKALGDKTAPHPYIVTVSGRGYRFAAEVKEVWDKPDEAAKEESASPVSAPAPAPRVRRSKAVIAAALLVAFSWVLLYWTAKQPSEPPSAVKSIAVLPFELIGAGAGDAEMEYLSDGISESLINSLSRLGSFNKVIARSSSFKYKGNDTDPQEMARVLGVEAVVTGRVHQRGALLQISVELMDARHGTHLWGEQYNRPASDLQTVQEEIARTISEKLHQRLTGAQAQQLAKHATENSQAYQHYQNGLFHLRKRELTHARKALDYFNQAIALDPNFALPWVGVANANHFFAGYSLLDPKEADAKAKAATQRALELDETLPEAHMALARIKRHEWDWSGAEREYRRAVELNPNLETAHRQYSNYLSSMGRHAEALAEIKRARELDPLSVALKCQEAIALSFAGRNDEALELILSIKLETGSGYFTLSNLYASKGMYEQAVQELQKAILMDGETTSMRCYLGAVFARSGRRKEAQAILNSLKTSKEYVSPTELAVLHMSLGDQEGALAMLEKAYAARDPKLESLKIDKNLDSLRSDPRFADLIQRVGLPQ